MGRTPPKLALGALLAAGLLAGAPALALDPRLPVLAAEPGAAEKLQAFAQAAESRPEVAAALSAAEAVPARDRIHQALRAIPAYAEAVDEYERRGDNAATWVAFLGTPEAQWHYLRAHATYFLGRARLAQDDLGGAADAFEQVRGRLRDGTPWTDEATFYLGYVYARLPELGGNPTAGRARARQTLAGLVEGEGGGALYAPPERVEEGARWLLRELDGDGMGPLLELAKRMETIERMIRQTSTGEATQKRQAQVMSEIDRLIALMREREQPGGS
jgi:hypothetical protein